MYYISSLISVIGNSISQIAIIWQISSEVKDSQLAYLVASVFLLTFIFSIILSPIIDRYVPIKIYKFSIYGRIFTLIITLFLIQYTNNKGLPLILLIIIQSIFTLIGSNTSFKMVKYLVGDTSLLKANALLSAISRSGYLGGMLLGGILIKFLSISIVLLIETIGYSLALILLSFIVYNNHSIHIDSVENTSYFKEISGGFVYILKQKWIIIVLIIAIVANMGITPSTTLLVPYVRDVMQSSSLSYSLIEILMIIGGIMASLITSRLAKILDQKNFLLRLFFCSASLQGISILIIGFQNLTNFIIYCSFLLIGISVSLFNLPFVTLLQKNVPDNISGRVWSLLLAISTLFSSIFHYVSGYLTNYMKLPNIYILFGLSSLIIIIFIYINYRKTLYKNIKLD